MGKDTCQKLCALTFGRLFSCFQKNPPGDPDEALAAVEMGSQKVSLLMHDTRGQKPPWLNALPVSTCNVAKKPVGTLGSNGKIETVSVPVDQADLDQIALEAAYALTGMG